MKSPKKVNDFSNILKKDSFIHSTYKNIDMKAPANKHQFVAFS